MRYFMDILWLHWQNANSSVCFISLKLFQLIRPVSSQNPYERSYSPFDDVSVAIWLMVAIKLTLMSADISVTFLLLICVWQLRIFA